MDIWELMLSLWECSAVLSVSCKQKEVDLVSTVSTDRFQQRYTMIL